MEQTAVEFLVQKLAENGIIHSCDIAQAKDLEEKLQRQKIIEFLKWTNNVTLSNPMALETDHEDIADMFLIGYYKLNLELE